jgi:hypothetical protein
MALMTTPATAHDRPTQQADSETNPAIRALDDLTLEAVHGGSWYRAFRDLGYSVPGAALAAAHVTLFY